MREQYAVDIYVEPSGRGALLVEEQLKLVSAPRDNAAEIHSHGRPEADRLRDLFDDIISRAIPICGSIPVRDVTRRCHFYARSVIGREIGIARFARCAGAADIKRVEEVPLEIQSLPRITTRESLDDDIGKHSRQLGLQWVRTQGDFRAVVDAIAISIRFERVRLIGQDFEAVRQSVTVSIGLQRVCLVEVDFVTILETVGVRV